MKNLLSPLLQNREHVAGSVSTRFKTLAGLSIAVGVGLSFSVLLAACGASDQGTGTDVKKAEPRQAAQEKSGLMLSPEELQRAGIRTEILALQTVDESLTVTATIRANQDRIAHIAPRVEGRVIAVAARLGDTVRAGQVLATLDSLVLGEAHSAHIQAHAAQRVAQADYSRAEALNAEEIIPQKDYWRAKAEFEKSSAELRASEDRLRLLGVIPDESSLHAAATFPVTAPFAGTVIQKQATLGDLAHPEESMFTVADLSKLWIEANLGEAQLGRVRPGARAMVMVAAYPGEPFVGRVAYIGSVFDPDTHTIPARIEVDNPDGRLKPEMFATASIATAQTSALTSPEQKPQRAVLSVPDEAIVLMQGQPTVFVATPNGFEPRPIETGKVTGSKPNGRTQVQSGLVVGDQLVVSGAYALKARLLKSQISDEH